MSYRRIIPKSYLCGGIPSAAILVRIIADGVPLKAAMARTIIPPPYLSYGVRYDVALGGVPTVYVRMAEVRCAFYLR